MSRFDIKAIARSRAKADGYYAEPPLSGFGTEIHMDGKPFAGVRSFDLHLACDDVVTARIEMIATESLDVEVDAIAQITVVVADSRFIIEETPLPNGGRRLRAVLDTTTPVAVA